jgi:hypothetical protein
MIALIDADMALHMVYGLGNIGTLEDSTDEPD